jgi:predicted metalloprotease with PDZ domain
VYLRDEAKATAPSATADRNDGGADESDEEVLTEPGKDGGVSGMDVRVVGDDAIVTRVRPGSAADLAGVQAGWLMVSADGQGIQQM